MPSSYMFPLTSSHPSPGRYCSQCSRLLDPTWYWRICSECQQANARRQPQVCLTPTTRPLIQPLNIEIFQPGPPPDAHCVSCMIGLPRGSYPSCPSCRYKGYTPVPPHSTPVSRSPRVFQPHYNAKGELIPFNPIPVCLFYLSARYVEN